MDLWRDRWLWSKFLSSMRLTPRAVFRRWAALPGSTAPCPTRRWAAGAISRQARSGMFPCRRRHRLPRREARRCPAAAGFARHPGAPSPRRDRRRAALSRAARSASCPTRRGICSSACPFCRRVRGPCPRSTFAFHDAVLAIDGIDRRAFLAGSEAGIAALREALRAPAPKPTPMPPLDWCSECGRTDYEARVARVIAYIRDGDIFQANLSHRFLGAARRGARCPGDLSRAARRQSRAVRAPSSSTDARFIASTSPERFLRLAGRNVETRPIKGTARRSLHPRQDRHGARRLWRRARRTAPRTS